MAGSKRKGILAAAFALALADRELVQRTRGRAAERLQALHAARGVSAQVLGGVFACEEGGQVGLGAQVEIDRA